ncbi:MAG: sulfatase, partial [Acidobacteria bacterium]
MASDEAVKRITRRHFFRDAGFGIGALALAELAGHGADGTTPAAPRVGAHFPPRAKNIIYLFMAGGPSSVDLFDNKPKLRELNGQPCPESLLQGEKFAFIKGVPRLLGSPHEFKRFGRSGQELSSLLPHLGEVADDIAVVRSMHTTQFNHAPAQIFMNSGHQIVGRPSMGAWLSYGLGSENK